MYDWCMDIQQSLTGKQADDCKSILHDIAFRNGWKIIRMETDKDHVHILLQYPPTDTVSGIVQKLKRESTHYMWKLHGSELRHHYWYQKTLWSKGYFFCSIGEVSEATIAHYIENQG